MERTYVTCNGQPVTESYARKHGIRVAREISSEQFFAWSRQRAAQGIDAILSFAVGLTDEARTILTHAANYLDNRDRI